MPVKISTDPHFIFFTTRDFAFAAGLELSAASKQLARLRDKGLLTLVTRGLWANTEHPQYSPLGVVPYLLGNEHGYVSFLTALHLHGLISQIPSKIQIATTGHSRILKSPLGVFEFIKIQPRLMQSGIVWSESKTPYLIAEPEKALLDVLYISTRKGRRFSSLPELDFEESGFREKYFTELLKNSILDKAIQSAIKRHKR